ncbi:halocyanin domain-containing protein [Natrononativus amylolyticus]|uniref:halocyanin domain-containing protein n=1 Tax=Natrononativus amylolyticus TaxID=2963434 RepID=UPI0020CD389A|nr:halocyanin domain-containing protein [Natrononativus amylolyticus]
MTPNDGVSRRTALRLAGIAALPVAVAGCTSDDDNGDGSDDAEYVDDEAEYDGWLEDTPNYEGTLDYTGEDEVTVDVGAGDGFQFDPAAIRVDEGTTVVWEWTGDGGGHDVVDTDGAFESEMKTAAGETFEHTFDETGVYTYVCVPHENMDMKGAVDVV